MIKREAHTHTPMLSLTDLDDGLCDNEYRSRALLHHQHHQQQQLILLLQLMAMPWLSISVILFRNLLLFCFRSRRPSVLIAVGLASVELLNSRALLWV